MSDAKYPIRSCDASLNTKRCIWAQDGTTWETSCGEYFQFEYDECPSQYKFCPNCGLLLEFAETGDAQ